MHDKRRLHVRLSHAVLGWAAVAFMGGRLPLPDRLGGWIVNKDATSLIARPENPGTTFWHESTVALLEQRTAAVEALAGRNAMLFAAWKLMAIVEEYADELPDEIMRAAAELRAVSSEFVELPSVASEEA